MYIAQCWGKTAAKFGDGFLVNVNVLSQPPIATCDNNSVVFCCIWHSSRSAVYIKGYFDYLFSMSHGFSYQSHSFCTIFSLIFDLRGWDLCIQQFLTYLSHTACQSQESQNLEWMAYDMADRFITKNYQEFKLGLWPIVGCFILFGCCDKQHMEAGWGPPRVAVVGKFARVILAHGVMHVGSLLKPQCLAITAPSPLAKDRRY